MSDKFKYTGIYTCPHSVYGTMTVVNYSEVSASNEFCIQKLHEYAAINPNPLADVEIVDEPGHDEHEHTNDDNNDPDLDTNTDEESEVLPPHDFDDTGVIAPVEPLLGSEIDWKIFDILNKLRTEPQSYLQEL